MEAEGGPLGRVHGVRVREPWRGDACRLGDVAEGGRRRTQREGESGSGQPFHCQGRFCADGAAPAASDDKYACVSTATQVNERDPVAQTSIRADGMVSVSRKLGSYNEIGMQQHMDQRIAQIANRQHGVFSRTQAVRCGATNEAIRWREKVGRWERLHPKIYRLAGAPRTWRQTALAACLYLGPQATLSYRAAAALRGLAAFRSGRVEVTVPRHTHRSAVHRVKIHWLQDPIPDEDITTIDGIPVTKPARTLLDLASVEPEEVVERCLDDALRRRLVSLPFLERWLRHPRRKRHRGAPVLGRLVDARATIGVTERPLETNVLRLLRHAGLPIPMLQYEVRAGDRLIGRLDFAYPDHRVGIEADGFRHHDSRRAFDKERWRRNELQVMGWLLLHITSEHVEREPDMVAAWVRAVLTHGGAKF